MMRHFFKILLSYIKRHVTVLIAVLLCIAIFYIVFSLYALPTEAVLYAAALSLAAFLVLGIIRFCAFYRRHMTLLALREKLAHEFPALPPPTSILEADYQSLLAAQYEGRVALASRADKALTDMADYYTLWAHQIKIPIAAMRLLLEARVDPALSAELFRIEQYVGMVLSYVRMESDSTDYVLKRQPLDPIVRQAVRKYARLFIAKKLQLDYRAVEGSVLSDEKWLLFAIEQILSNAIKYTEAGGVSIYTEDGALVIVDTGIGIAPEDLPRVCEKGFTGYIGRLEKKSTGIGLYLCKRVLNKLGHDIRLESEPGKGTKVYILFSSSLASG